MKNILLILILIVISCNSKSQGDDVDLSKKNITYQEIDKETGWKRISLINPHKWGFVNDKNEIVIPFEYDFINPFEHGIAFAKNNNREFFITKKNLRLKGDFEKVDIFSEHLAAVKKNKKWGFINEMGEIVIPIVYDTVDYFRPSGLCAVTKNGKAGFINKSGKEVIPIIYEEASQEMKDANVIVKNKGKWAVFDNSGKQLSDFIYDSFKSGYVTNFSKDAFKRDESTLFENGAALAIIDGKYEFINSQAKAAFPKNKFDSASVFDTFRNAIVKRNGKYGIIKTDGSFKVPLAYDFINYFDDNHAFSEYYNAKKGKVYSIFNRDLKKIAESYEPIYNDFSTDTHSVIIKNLKNKYGMISSRGDLEIPFEYDGLDKLDGTDFFKVSQNKKFGVINKNGSLKIPIIYKSLHPLGDDKALGPNTLFIANDSKIIDLNNVMKISGYNSITPIFNNENKLIVSKNKKFGIIDINKNIILSLEYDKISNWTEYGPRHSKFIVKNGKTGLIDEETFKVTVPPIYDKFRYMNGLIFVKKQNKAGIINEEGKVICDFVFDEIYPDISDFYGINNKEQRIYAKKGNAYFQIDAKGKILRSNLTKESAIKNSEIPEPKPPSKK